MGTEKTILLVDDDDFVRQNLKDALCEDGFVFLEAGDGATALDLIRTRQPDLVLLDLLMPTMSGLEVLEGLKRSASAVKVVVVSSLDSKGLVDQALECGAAGFIVKPFHPLEVHDEVARVLGP